MPESQPLPVTVLVVDDEPDVCRVVARYLREAGYHVLTAESGDEAVRLMRASGPIRAVLADLRMPQMGGRELAEHARQLHPSARILFMAGLPPSTADPLPGRVMAKPFFDGELVAEIRRLLEGE